MLGGIVKVMVLVRVGGGWGVDVCSAGEEDVRFDMDEVRTATPNIFSVINDGDHLIPTREYRPGVGERERERAHTQICITSKTLVIYKSCRGSTVLKTTFLK